MLYFSPVIIVLYVDLCVLPWSNGELLPCYIGLGLLCHRSLDGTGKLLLCANALLFNGSYKFAAGLSILELFLLL